MNNRTIKFRCFCHHSKKIQPVDNEDLGYYLDGADGIELMQFTGLLDKNGREIYEGDLVNFYTPGHPHGPEREDHTFAEVWYDENSAAFVFDKVYYDGWHGYGVCDVKDLEVVGNIFENSDKIKKYDC